MCQQWIKQSFVVNSVMCIKKMFHLFSGWWWIDGRQRVHTFKHTAAAKRTTHRSSAIPERFCSVHWSWSRTDEEDSQPPYCSGKLHYANTVLSHTSPSIYCLICSTGVRNRPSLCYIDQSPWPIKITFREAHWGYWDSFRVLLHTKVNYLRWLVMFDPTFFSLGFWDTYQWH